MMELISRKDAAARLGVSVATVLRLTETKALAYYRVGGQYRYTAEDIDAYLAASRVEALPQAPAAPAYSYTPAPIGAKPAAAEVKKRGPGRPRRNAGRIELQEYIPGMRVVG